jgi:hypothetical protein
LSASPTICGARNRPTRTKALCIRVMHFQ